MQTAPNIYELTEPLCRGAARIAFKKVGGRSVERYATACVGVMLKYGATPDDCFRVVNHNADPSKSNILFWDIQEGGIRSFRKDSFEDIFPGDTADEVA